MTTATSPIDLVLSKLPNVQPEHDGQWNAKCPLHDDNRNSLAISATEDGKVLLRCLAGCPTAAVVEAAGLRMSDLFPRQNGHRNGHHAEGSNGQGAFKIVATYDYRDERGELVYQAVRLDPKDFRQRKPKPDGGWDWKTKGTRRLVYRLPELLASDKSQPVFVPEGGKDCDALVCLGLIATTNHGGAGKFAPECAVFFAGRNVVLLPDNDKAGRDHVRDVARKLKGVAESVKILELDGLPDKGDVSDWLAAGGTKEALLNLAAAAPLWQSSRTNESNGRALVPAESASNDNLWCDNSDLGNARLFVKMHGTKVRFCHPWQKWLFWDGTRWAIDETGELERLAKDISDHRWRQAREARLDEDGMRWAVKSANAERIAAMLKLARSEPGIPIMPGDLDRDPWLLNCQNGTVDLRTGELRPHNQADMLTKLCPTPFNPDAESYNWDRFLEAIFVSQSLVDFCRRYFGYSITGSVREQILLILWGCGSNGKSTLLNALMDTLGSDYTLKAVADLLLVKQNESHPTERADLFGKRFVVCVETADGRGLNEALVKEMTGGDRIRARRLYENFWEFVPTHKPALCTNHKPRVRGTDHAIWRRLALVPFNVQFWNPDKGETGPDEQRQDKALPEKLATEAEGILAWLIRGCLEWKRDGLRMPPEVMLATSEYQAEQDSIGAFLAEKCLVGDACRVRASALYTTYREWSEAMGEHPLGQRKFGEAMTAKGFERIVSAGTWYVGITTN